MTDVELDEINEKISALFEGRTLDDVATVLTIQLGMLVMQAGEDAGEAEEFLGEITAQVEDMIRTASEGEPAN